MSKCQFGQSQVRYLGFLATAEGIKACPEKGKPIMQVAPPTNRKELDSFIDSVGVHQRFISQYSVKTEPLPLLKKKDQQFLWGAQISDRHDEWDKGIAHPATQSHQCYRYRFFLKIPPPNDSKGKATVIKPINVPKKI
jgi:hypothetical protein